MIGLIMLVGIVVNNGIVLVDTINQLRREEGKGLHQAILIAGPQRLRPILMTALTTILSMLPMAFFWQRRRPDGGRYGDRGIVWSGGFHHADAVVCAGYV